MHETEGFSHQYVTISGLRYHYVREPARPGGDPKIHAPTPVLWVENGPVSPVAWSDRLSDLFADMILRTVRQCGHWVQREQPELVNRAITEFIAP